jgi:MFS family permease
LLEWPIKWYRHFMTDGGWRGRLGLSGRLAPLAAGLFVFGLGEELWSRYLPEYLRFLGASAFAVGAFGALRDFLDAAYAYPGGWISDRLGSRRALLLFALATTAGFGFYFLTRSVAGVFLGVFLVMAWKSLGLPATFAMIGEEASGSGRLLGFTAQAILKRIPIVLAPPVGGLLLERLGMADGMRAGFLVSIALSVAMLAGLALAFRKGQSDAARSPRSAEAIRLHPVLKRLLVADVLVRLCEGLPDVFLVVWALEVLRLSPSQFGIATSVLMATAILSYVPAAALAGHVERKPFVIATFLCFALFPVAVVLSRSFPQLLGAYVIGGLREVGEPSRKALIVDLASAGARGKTVGLYYAIRGFSVAGAAAVGGALWTIRPALTFYAAFALGIAGTLWALVTLPARPAAVEAAP